MISTFLKGFIIFLIIDAIWIYGVALPMYQSTLGNLINSNMAQNPALIAAAFGVYILLVLGIVVFVMPLTKNMTLLSSALYGGLYGLIAYGVFAMTNYSVLKPWTAALMFADLFWGFSVCAIVTVCLKLL